ncbi:MAG: succinyl-CoA--3-ketoacid-CoA transferase [Eubacterium sp.]|jgi:acetate CoA/acetoacetate CoA-transferase beta subunit|uniref:succinyl-CoA--3-ketoacid-CoA transferase n=1 Tax=Clostridium sp. (strain SY8519) TaxID=1042156 RepID=UPI0002171F00|nr:succinyl-CoA--3-ketoacid-CoA transferase [Clostridium sp. SY8519]BAK46668.1 acyl CoA:acetate/3-ketoacid CoA transferase, beta subunit [Clostridium sp. SY8519]
MDNRAFIAKRAAKYFKVGDVVNLGVGIPSLCSDYTEKGVMFQTENGLIGVGDTATDVMVTDRSADASSRPFVPMPGASVFDTAYSFAIIRSGRLAATVLGGLQVSEQGDLANWASPGRAFGMGGAMDLCNGAKQVIVAMELTTKQGKPKIVNTCSFPLTALHCVDHIVTEQCVIDVTPEGLVLREVRQGITPEQIQEQVEPKLIIPDDIAVMEE